MASEAHLDRLSPFILMTRQDLGRVLLLGGIIGFLVWGLGLALDHFVFDVYFCQSEVSRQCGSAKNYAAVAANSIGMIVALGGLIRLGVYRPLLVVIASLLSAWGIVQISWGLGVFTGLLAAALLYAVAFGLYAWVVRIREFWVALIVILVLVVAVRLALMA